MTTPTAIPPTIKFSVARYSINLVTAESGTPVLYHRLPTISIKESDSASSNTGIIVFVPTGESAPAPSYDSTRGVVYLYYPQEVYAAMIDLLGRAGFIQCKVEWDPNLHQYWATLAGPDIVRP